MAQQLELSIRPVIKYNFENYIVSEHNTQAVSHLKFLIKHPENSYIYLWGSEGIGKSHLLHAMVEQASANNLTASYFSFDNLSSYTPEILESFESFDIVCLDDIQHIAGNKLWEEHLFGFYNRIKDANKVLVIAASSSVIGLGIKLPDLQSRLAWGVSYNLKPLDDEDKKLLLKTKAHERGMTLPDELAQFLISRGRRDINGLFEMLNQLDQLSLRYKRKLTIPFAKEVLGL